MIDEVIIGGSCAMTS